VAACALGAAWGARAERRGLSTIQGCAVRIQQRRSGAVRLMTTYRTGTMDSGFDFRKLRHQHSDLLGERQRDAWQHSDRCRSTTPQLLCGDLAPRLAGLLAKRHRSELDHRLRFLKRDFRW